MFQSNILKKTWAKLKNPICDGKCGYYLLFQTFEYLEKSTPKEFSISQNSSMAKAKRKDLPQFGKQNVNNYVWYHDKSISTKLAQILPDGYSHLFDLHSPNLCMDWDKLDAFMETIRNSVYTEDFENQEEKGMDKNSF